MSITFLPQSRYTLVSQVRFPGGELHPTVAVSPEGNTDCVYLQALIRNSDDLMELILVMDACRNMDVATVSKTEYHLDLPYVPYGRQDRVALPGEAFGLKVFAQIINSLGFRSVRVYDAHSYVTTALIDRVFHLSHTASLSPMVSSLIHKYHVLDGHPRFEACKSNSNFVLLSPDMGASKKTQELASFCGLEMVQATKVRDPATGKLSAPSVSEYGLETLRGKEVIIIPDDICDGGGTFLMLANYLREQWIDADLVLIVTNGIFSKGKDVLFEHFTHVLAKFDWTTQL